MDPENFPPPKRILAPGPRPLRLPGGIPRRHRVRDSLGFGSFSCHLAVPDDPPGHATEVALGCCAIVVGCRGIVLMESGLSSMVIGPGEAAGLLPGPHRWHAVGPHGGPAVLALATMPDAAVERLLRRGKLWRFFLRIAAQESALDALATICPLPSASELPLGQILPGRLGEAMLLMLGDHPFRTDGYVFLARGPLRHRVGEPDGDAPADFVFYDPWSKEGGAKVGTPR